jgi:Domain of unknown function (DUF4328)
MKKLKPNGQRAKNAITLIWIVLTLEIISLISEYFQYGLLQNAQNGIEISIEVADANDMRQRIIGILYLIALIVSAVTFIQWFRRAYYNLQLKTNHLTYSDGLAAGSWFIPIICFYRPYQIMKELYHETKSLLMKNKINFSQVFNNSSLGLWWTLWVINNLLGHFIFRYPTDTIDQLTEVTVASMISNIIGIPLALLAIKIVKNYSIIEPLLTNIDNYHETTNR